MMNEPKMCELHAKCVILVRSDFFSRTNKCSEAIIFGYLYSTYQGRTTSYI